MFISEAYAQTADPGAAGGAGLLVQFAPLILIFVVFYFLLIRPQQKRAKEHRDMLGALRRGDRIVTGGGIVGTVQKVADDELTVEIAENVRVKVIRSTVTTVLARTEPAKNGGSGNGDKAEETAAPAAANAPAEAEKPKGLARFLARK
ncbi:preprotein translocase subunit YajC [Inquilinus limosus]|uniref:preprotein translocase subunit YajC n=1 Tax=Inquilinus limosus TaxID=171674 RepID=UPI00041EFA53|nr:preprotein translocase subunit YajC [Inquilinus limosus]